MTNCTGVQNGGIGWDRFAVHRLARHRLSGHNTTDKTTENFTLVIIRPHWREPIIYYGRFADEKNLLQGKNSHFVGLDFMTDDFIQMFHYFVLDFVVPHFNAESHLWLFCKPVVCAYCALVVQKSNWRVEIFFLVGRRWLVIIDVFINFNEKIAITTNCNYSTELNVSGEICSFVQEEGTPGLLMIHLQREQQTAKTKKMARMDLIVFVDIPSQNFFSRK
jgi:hypothetical protein